MDMNEAIQVAMTAVLASSGLWSVILWLFQSAAKKRAEERDSVRQANGQRLQRVEERVNKVEETNALQSKAIVAQMHHTLYAEMSRVLTEYADGRRSCIDVDEMHDISVMYDAYHDMGGNGTCKIMYERVQQIPLAQTNNPAIRRPH